MIVASTIVPVVMRMNAAKEKSLLSLNDDLIGGANHPCNENYRAAVGGAFSFMRVPRER